MSIVLASKSPYKQRLLQSLGVDFTIMDSSIDEQAIKDKFPGQALLCSQELALAKARAVIENCGDALVIGCDQMASCENRYLGKPKTREKAIENLLWMRGKQVLLHTSVAVLVNGEEEVFTEVAKLKIRKNLEEKDIERYVDFAEPFDCSASFKIEKGGFALFESIECGDFSSIEGLPLVSLSAVLLKHGQRLWELK